jgi:RNA polymerase sigma factor (sigma-70 family)
MAKILSLFKTEYDLAKAIGAGDKNAQREFYQKYSGKLLGICSRYLDDRMHAEDVMIEGIMKVFEKINQFTFSGSFEGWVKRIVVNEALMALRSKKNIIDDIEDFHHIGYENTSYSDFEVNDLMKIINDLPVGYRTVFNLYAIEGYSHAEIAEKLDISEGTSKSQLSRARSILQEKLTTQKNENFGVN